MGILEAMNLEIDRVLDVVTSRLPAAGVDAVMIGGHAVNHYGVFRTTQDIDFMITAADEDTVRRIMQEAGFSNVAVHESVIFFNQPGSPLRVDFLKVDRETMSNLLAGTKEIEYLGVHRVKVPQLRDLLAMKLFALSHGGAGREDKDFSDIVRLVIENNFDVSTELLQLCRQFATEGLWDRLRARIKELQDA